MSRQTASSHTPSASTSGSTPQAKRNIFGIPGTNRRHSLGISPSMPNGNPSLAVASSPGPPTTPAGSGIPSFRTLRSFLPFGGNKNAPQQQAFTSPSTPATTKSSFSFATVRRSMAKDRERKISLGDETFRPQVISIGRSKSDSQVGEDGNIRRSVSLSRLDDQLSSLDSRSSDTAPTLRTPSPGIPLSQELSTIIEADSSGVSRHNFQIPISRTASSSPPESRTPSPTILNPAFLHPMAKRPSNNSSITARSSDFDADTSMLEISPTEVEREVLDAMRASDSPSMSALDWSNAGQPVIIDADSANDSFTSEEPSILPTPDPALIALLSPNTMAAKARERQQPPSLLPRFRQGSQSSGGSPTSSRFPPSPKTPTTATATPRHSPPGGLSPSRSPPAPTSPGSPMASTSTPARKAFSANSSHLFTPAATSSLAQSTGSRLFNPSKSTNPGIGKGRPSVFKNMLSGSSSSREGNSTLSSSINSMPSPTPKISLSMPPSPSKVLSLHRGSLDSRRSPVRGAFAETPRRPSLDSSRPKLEGSRRTSFEVRRGTPASIKPKVPNLLLPRRSSSPDRPSPLATDATPSPTVPDSRSGSSSPYRPSFDSSSRPSLDISRPSSVARIRDRSSQTSSLRGHPDRPRTTDRLSPVPHSGGSSTGSSNGPPAARTRKRSMSVQERLGRTRLFGHMSSSTNASAYDLSTTTLTSLTSQATSRQSDIGGEPQPKPDWMNARGASRVLRGVGLLKDRDSESSDGTERFSLRSKRDRSGSLGQDLRGHNGVLAPSPLSGGGAQPTERVMGRFASMRGAASDYNPSHNGRALSRMAFSDVGGGGSSHRRGSGSFSAHGGGSGNGLMESPTFTASSSSRDRETPRSAVSTAATSVSGHGGRDRDEIRDLKDKHVVEMEALLNALSDSQRTVRMLREENNDLRDRLDKLGNLEAENDELGHMCSDLQRDLAQMKRHNEVLREQLDLQRSADLGRRTNERLSPQWKSISLRTPVPRQAVSARSSRYEHQFRPQEDVDTRDVPTPVRSAPPVFEREDSDDRHDDALTLEDLDPSATPHVSSSTHIRRGSDTSSVFPMPPPNMSMIMQEGDPGHSFFNQLQSGVLSNYNFPPHSPGEGAATPMSRAKVSEPEFNDHNDYNHTFNTSVSSALSINRTMAGSPTESLNLDPLHDRHLRDLEQVDLGVKLDEMRKQTLGRLVPDPDAW